MDPRKPKRIHPLAERILNALSEIPESVEIVIGGYLALSCYAEYRQTNDVDAWWRSRASARVERAIRQVMEGVARSEGATIGERRFGDTVSYELVRGGRKVLSFQIATRSVELEAPVPSPWPPILVETPADNVGSKMNALVDRGAPRDFLDARMIVERGIASIAACWEYWQRKNPSESVTAAKQKVTVHLESLQARRPLEAIEDETERERARATRQWFRSEFLRL